MTEAKFHELMEQGLPHDVIWRLYAASKVILLGENTRQWLKDNDIKSLEQLEKATTAIEDIGLFP